MTAYCSYMTGILLLTAVVFLFVTVLFIMSVRQIKLLRDFCLNFKYCHNSSNLLSWSSSWSHSNVMSPKSYLDKGIVVIVVMVPEFQSITSKMF